MSNKNYFKNFGVKFGFFAKYFRIFRLLIIVAYLFYLETLVVNVFSAVEYVPGVDEVKKRFSPIAAKTEVIDSIEKYFSDKGNGLDEKLQKEIKNNPFSPHKTDVLNPLSSPSVSENNITNPVLP